MRFNKLILFISFLFSVQIIPAQGNKNLAELLGYPRDSKLLIIHADDMGLSHSVNMACLNAFDSKGITSGSIMVPCPWARDIETYVKEHPQLDIGIHLTMTSEWDNFKWGGVAPSDQIPSLLDKEGNFYASVEELGKVAKGEEAKKELKAQIDKAIAAGVIPSHIDTHMGSVLANPELTRIYLELSDEYHLPVLFPRAYLGMLPADLAKIFGTKIYLLDNLYMLDKNMAKEKWIDAYKAFIDNLKPGFNQLIVHLGLDNDEMRAICKGHDDYGSQWRQNDLDVVTGSEFLNLLKSGNIILITWRQVKDAMNSF